MLGCSSFNSFNCNSLGVFNKTNFPQALVGYVVGLTKLFLYLDDPLFYHIERIFVLLPHEQGSGRDLH